MCENIIWVKTATMRITVFALILCIGVVMLEEAKSGPYIFVLKEMGTGEEGTGQIHFGNKLRSLGQGKYAYSDDFQIGVPLDNNIKIQVELQEWGNGGYRPRSITYTARGCEQVWKLAGTFLQTLLKSAGVEVEKCPIPSGNFTAHDMEPSISFDSIPVMKYMKCRVYFRFLYSNKLVGCLVLIGDIVPKPTAV